MFSIVKAQEQQMSSDVENRANAPAAAKQTPSLYPQPMTSKVTDGVTDGTTAVTDSSATAATLLPATITAAPEVGHSFLHY